MHCAVIINRVQHVPLPTGRTYVGVSSRASQPTRHLPPVPRVTTAEQTLQSPYRHVTQYSTSSFLRTWVLARWCPPAFVNHAQQGPIGLSHNTTELLLP